MKEVALEGVSSRVEEATVQVWFSEEGDVIQEGDDLVELSTEDGTLLIPAPASGVLVEVYYDEGEVVAKGEVLCVIDDEDDSEEEDDE
ncbi:MAG TPA: biotin/lipoyl-binding protein [Verrucomicrobiae bacterium]|jgi:pyruvate/2-oxoglutarate dehydrogenase complex dihydrolipoamide acyltransferase (E2) component|nr:biotin/lipoyl-binding protein [Verrucomicrobiae bacterium]